MAKSRLLVAQEAVSELCSNGQTRVEVAAGLGVHSAHITHLLNHGRLTPTMEDALIDQGLLPPRPKRHRLSIHKTDYESAALSIYSNMTQEFVVNLVRELKRLSLRDDPLREGFDG